MTGILSRPMAAPMDGWRAHVVRVGDAICSACTVVAAVALGVIVCINGANVFGRYFLAMPISWAEEAMLYLMVLTVFSGAAAVTWRQEHIKIEAFLEVMPPAARKISVALTGIVTLVALSMAVYASSLVVTMLHGFEQHSEALGILMWIPQSVVTVGLCLVGLLFIMRVLCALGAPARDPHPEA